MTTLKLLANIGPKTDILPKLGYGLFWLALFVATLGAGRSAQAAVTCTDEITVDVVVLDNPTVFNRLGAQNPNWITYALKRDVIAVNEVTRLPTGDPAGTNLTAGNVELRPDKRPRPLVVRSREGACLTVNFTNLLAPNANPNNPAAAELLGIQCVDPANEGNPACLLANNDQVAGRYAGFHATGTELATDIGADGSLVGANASSLVAPGESTTYHLYTPHEGAFVINSYGATLGSEANSGNLAVGMFGALNVQPKGAKFYRSQVTEEELRLATVARVTSDCDVNDVHGIDCNPGGQPIIDYEAVYPGTQAASEAACDAANPGDPLGAVFCKEGKAGLPILNMLDGNELVHSDINAIIVGPNDDGTFPPSTYPLESIGKSNPSLPQRLQPFREFSSIFHDEQTNSQVFPKWYNNPVLGYTLAGVKDQFMINYGSGGIGSEIIANRLHTGPMHDCADCAYEEFFLASQTVGDPAMLVAFPANSGIEACDPTNILGADCWRDPVNGANPPIPGNEALFQEDPSNVHHAYTGDAVKIRNIHAGSFEQHIFHLHNHQWLFNPNDDNANYLDAQEIMPGSGHTYELVYGGAGNRNQTVGDAIFHCHFYPHFAQGMWYHIRNHDVLETGTVLQVSVDADPTLDPQEPSLETGFHTQPFALRSGRPAAGARALPDGELLDGSPIPAIVPLPGKAMPQMPAKVSVKAVDRGDFGVLSGRRGPNELGQGADSAQAVVDFASVAGHDGQFGTADDVTPGFPFWLAGNSCGADGTDIYGNPITPTGDACPEGTVGQRMPTPVLDMLTAEGAAEAGYNPALAGGWDGGLPRHNLRGYTAGALTLDTQNRLDFRKVIKAAPPVYYPETGTALEKVSMAYQSVRNRPSVANALLNDDPETPEDEGALVAASFKLNGRPPVPGGPYNDPCVDDLGEGTYSGVPGSWHKGDDVWGTPKSGGATSAYGANNPRTYKVANVQIDAVFNKVGHHYSQERIIALWEDVAPTINKQRPPEPLVMRFNSFDCGKVLHSNLVPAEFELDDFQVRTPTDIIGQHIHLPKWDLTTGDGAANGWNYEDGSLAPLMVQERIEAINLYNLLAGANQGALSVLLENNFPDTWAKLPDDLKGKLATHIVDLTGLPKVPTIDTGDSGAGYVDGVQVVNYAEGLTHLEPLPHPFFKEGELVNGHHEYAGARTVIQRIFVDPVLNVAGVDRGLGLTFSHDHYGPSTFQQIGLYSTILAEPQGSKWVHNESGQQIGWLPDGTKGEGRDDGGPTTWQAVIDTPEGSPVKDHREFYFEMSDFQHAYEAGVYVSAGPDGRPHHPDAIMPVVNQPLFANATEAYAPLIQDTWQNAINPPLKLEATFPDVVTAKGACPGTVEAGLDPNGTKTNFDPDVPRPCAEAINISHSSMWVVNYRNEPVALRVYDPNKAGPDIGIGGTPNMGAQADGPAGDLALAFQSRDDRAIAQFNTKFGDTPYPTGAGAPYCSGNDGDLINCDRGAGDPFTPIMRAYEGDEVKIKIQVGATEEQHQTSVHGLKWLSNGSGFGRSPNSGWRNFQSHGISEQFSLQAPLTPALKQAGQTVDYLYAQDATRDGIWMGTWGILRTYGKQRSDLVVLDSNKKVGDLPTFSNASDFNGVCPKNAPVASFDVTAVLANEVLPNNLGVTIPPNTAPVDNVGGVLDPAGGTLVYNRRGTEVPIGCQVPVGEGEACPVGLEIFASGPLNDPTAMMYVMTDDLMSVAEEWAVDNKAIDPDAAGCFNPDGNKKGRPNPNAGKFNPTLASCGVSAELLDGCVTSGGGYDPKLNTCRVKLRREAPVEPLVLRANAGDCIDVTLRNKLVNEQAYTMVDGVKKKVYYSDGNPVFADLGKNLDWYVENADGMLEIVDRATAKVVLDLPPDLAGWEDMMWIKTRRIQPGVPPPGTDPAIPAKRFDEMHFFNNNLIRPGSYVGLHPQLVTYDGSRDDGVAVGKNQPSLAAPGGTATMQFYAGEIEYLDDTGNCKGKNGNKHCLKVKATPIEFGGSNLLSADRVKQPQKGLFGALVIEPQGATVTEGTMVPDGQGLGGFRPTRAQVDVQTLAGAPVVGFGDSYREALAMGHKIANLRWKDGSAIKNIHQGELGREGAEDSGHAGFNYGMEPSWFRFKLPPNAPFGNAQSPVGTAFGSIPNVHELYSNELVALEPNSYPGGDPATPVFTTTAGMPTRIHVLNGASADRDGTFVLHGHLWQRDPFVCPGQARAGLTGLCEMGSIGSLALGLNPVGKYMGGEEGMGHAYGHWPILFNAGGTGAVPGDYLFRDYTPSGNRNGQFGILRVQ